MIYRLIIGLLYLLIIGSCIQNSTKSDAEDRNHVERYHGLKSGLLIHNGINRGIGYIDSLGSVFNLRYIPIAIANDTTISIDLHLNFSKEYNHYPDPDTNEKYRLILLPEEWALDGTEINQKMIDELSNYIIKPSLNVTIEPGEEHVFAIGTLYPNPPHSTGILPNTLFVHTDKSAFPTCDWLMNEIPASNTQLQLGIKLHFGPNCQVISCGWLSYP